MSSWIEIILNKCKLSRRKLMRSTVWNYLCRIPVENVDIPRGHAAKFSTRYFFFFNFFYYFLDSVSHPGDLLLFLGKKKLLKWQDKKKKKRRNIRRIRERERERRKETKRWESSVERWSRWCILEVGPPKNIPKVFQFDSMVVSCWKWVNWLVPPFQILAIYTIKYIT